MIRDEIAESWNQITALSADMKKTFALTESGLARGVVIFGAGSHGQDAARYLNKTGVPVLCFADNDPDKQAGVSGGIRIVSPQDATVKSAATVFIAIRHDTLTVQRQLANLGIESLPFNAFFVIQNLERFAHVRNNLLTGARSKLSYDGILKTMLTGDNSYCAAVIEENQYFALPEFVNFGNDHFVDAGAYVGDTIEKFIWMCSGVFRRIYAFEPGEPQLAAMKHRIERLRREWMISESAVILENAGLADKDTAMTMSLWNVPANTSLSYDTVEESKQAGKVSCYALDNYLAGRPATFIKADIEGMELAMLQGAKNTIRQWKPKMALSIYHTPAHLFEIAEYINGLVPEYRMAVRQHAPIFAESVLYCWVPQENRKSSALFVENR